MPKTNNATRPTPVGVQRLLAQIRVAISAMTDDQRLEFFSAVTEGYCRHCGRDDSDSPHGCQCWNDE